MSALPRGTCPVCGADVAVRRNGEVRQHDRWETFAAATGLDGRRRATCPGTGAPAKPAERWEAWEAERPRAPEESVRAALGERLSNGGLAVPRGFE